MEWILPREIEERVRCTQFGIIVVKFDETHIRFSYIADKMLENVLVGSQRFLLSGDKISLSFAKCEETSRLRKFSRNSIEGTREGRQIFLGGTGDFFLTNNIFRIACEGGAVAATDTTAMASS